MDLGGGTVRQNFEMVKGDTFSIGIEIEFDESPQQLDTAYFTCKSIINNEMCFQKSLGDGISFVKSDGNKIYYRVRVEPSDTKGLERGKYYYDLQINVNSDTYTILKGILTIENEITE